METPTLNFGYEHVTSIAAKEEDDTIFGGDDAANEVQEELVQTYWQYTFNAFVQCFEPVNRMVARRPNTSNFNNSSLINRETEVFAFLDLIRSF